MLKRLFSKDKHFYNLFHSLLGITPSNIELYKLALIHRSASITLPDGSLINNERMEFLGDAVLEAVCSEILFVEFPEMTEGDLTQLRSKIVSRESLNNIASQIGIHNHIIATPQTIPTNRQNLAGDALEAILGALFLDKGYNTTSRITYSIIQKYIDLETIAFTEQDFKSRVLEWAQKTKEPIAFNTTTAPEHTDRNPAFTTTLTLENQIVGTGTARSKKQSEQLAAKQFFDTLS